MSDDRQMNLFDWKPAEPTRQLISFPRDRRIGEIKAVARSLFGRKQEAADRAWRLKVNQISKQMARAGFDDVECARQIALFQGAVQSELDRISWTGENSGSRPGGAA